MQSGQTPIVIWWDYLLASEISSAVPTFKIVIPSDAHYAAYYSQAISETAPHPACARLWEEYLYSTTGQNLWLQGKARPIELQTLVTNGTVNKAADAALPRSPGGRAELPHPGPGVCRRGQGRAAMGDRGRLADGSATDTVVAPDAAGGPGARPGRTWRARLHSARALIGILPFTIYVTLGLALPAVAIAVGAFQDSTTGDFTLTNIKTAASGIYLHGFEDHARGRCRSPRSCRASSASWSPTPSSRRSAGRCCAGA